MATTMATLTKVMAARIRNRPTITTTIQKTHDHGKTQEPMGMPPEAKSSIIAGRHQLAPHQACGRLPAGLQRVEVRRAPWSLVRPGPPSPVSLTEDEAAYALASLAAAADGTVTHAETRRVEAEWNRYAAARGLTPVQARAVAARCRQLRATLGSQALRESCEDTLRAAPHAKEAVRMAMRVAHADGELKEAEQAHLESLLALVDPDGKPSRREAAGR